MKKIFLSILLAVLTLSIYAAKSTGTVHVFTQPDGTQLSVRLLGDEEFSWYQTSDEVLLIREDNIFYIARTDSNGELYSTGIIAHDADKRNSQELQAISTQDKSLFFNTESEANKAKSKHRVISGYPQSYFCPHSGTIHVPVIMMNYTDTTFTFKDKEIWENYFNGQTTQAYTSDTRYDGYGSVARFFDDASQGNFHFVFDIYGPYTAKYGHHYYGKAQGTGKEQQLLEEAIKDADADIDFTQYDSNKDGNVDMVYVLYAGTGANTSGDDNDFWPSCWHSSGYYFTADNKKINIIGGANELALAAYKNSGKAIRAGIGVTCHEISHGLGLPDLYWTVNGTPKDAQGYTDYNNCGPEDWDLMDGGENLYGAIWPCQLTAWEREILGWLDVEELTEAKTVTLFPLNMEGGKACRVTNPANQYEYYIIENYQKTEWNYYINNMYGAGLMITHVNAGSWGLSMTPNNVYGKPSVTLLPADGFILASYSEGTTMQYKGEVVTMPSKTEYETVDGKQRNKWTYYYFNPDTRGDPYPGTQKVTSVAAYKNYTGDDMVEKYPITDITRNDDGSITFKFMGGTPTAINTVDADSALETPIYTIDGRMVGTEASSLPHGIYIRNGHKFVK